MIAGSRLSTLSVDVSRNVSLRVVDQVFKRDRVSEMESAPANRYTAEAADMGDARTRLCPNWPMGCLTN